jgi:hypothetical protein
MNPRSFSASSASLALSTVLFLTASCDGSSPIDLAAEAQGAEAALAASPESPATDDQAENASIGEFHLIRLSNTNLCVQPLDGSTGDVPVELSQCSPSAPAQNWLFKRISSRDFEIINQPSGKCLYVNGPAATNVPLFQADCNVSGGSAPASNALWKPSRLTGFATLMSRIGHRDSGLCADSFGNAFDGIGLRTFHCNGTPPQTFVVGVE